MWPKPSYFVEIEKTKEETLDELTQQLENVKRDLHNLETMDLSQDVKKRARVELEQSCYLIKEKMHNLVDLM